MRKVLRLLLAGLLVVALTVHALAWEFSMTGEYEYRFRNLGRAGNTDLFGIATLQDTTAIANTAGLAVESGLVGFAGPTLYNRGLAPALASDASNFSNGGTLRASTVGGALVAQPTLLITRGGYSQTNSDAFYNDSRLTFLPEVRLNPAIKIHGVYNIGGYRNKYFQNFSPTAINGPNVANFAPPFERYYQSQVSSNAYDTAGIGSWEQFGATVQIPWGIWSIGVRNFPFGVGATFAYNTRLEAFLTIVPYGPLRFLHAIWLSRGRFAESWTTTPDSQQKNNLFQAALATYDNGPLSAGLGTIWRTFHGKAIDSTFLGALGGAVNGIDESTLVNIVFTKYNNGRFFANAEYSWVNVDRYRLGPNLNPQPAPFVPGVLADSAPLNLEAYHVFAEAGWLCGPAKLSLLYALASGRVLNNTGYTIPALQTANANLLLVPTYKTYAPYAINYQAMVPYQFLMFDTFAGGNQGGWQPLDVTFVADEHGMMTDAYAYAARFDYAVAANLNVWSSFIYAHRLEKAGTFKGEFLSDGTLATRAQRTAFVAANFGAASGEVGGPINPFVDNGFIGWEGNAGVDWKLLENMTMFLRYSYWQPGDWFTEAYQAVGVVGGIAVNNALVQGRSPIQAFSGSLLFDF